jgi:probable F420-dependent oxidoreductase
VRDLTDLRSRLSCYALAGRVTDPSPAGSEARTAEALGLGTIWVGDRRDMKDAAVVCGAMAQATSTIHIGTAVTYVGTRHPQVLAAMGATMQGLSGGRFRMGFGRSVPDMYRRIGLTPPTTAALRDNAEILRRLWVGDAVTYHGPLGSFEGLRLSARYDGDPPELLLAAAGPRTIELAGEAYDGVFVEPLMSPEAVAGIGGRVRDAARAAGRDPERIRVIPCLLVASDLPPEVEAAAVRGRMVAYLQNPGSGDRKVALNGWDPAILDAIRSHRMFDGHGHETAYADANFTFEALVEVAELIPDEWVHAANAVGPIDRVAAKVRDYFAAGADEVLLHASAPEFLGPLVAALAGD